MITNEQIEMLKTVRSGWAGEWAECCAIDAAIDTLEKLPATRDGVRVSPGMKVYTVERDGVFEWEIKSIRIGQYHDTEAYQIGDWALWLDDGEGEAPYGPRDCYSTRAAAEAASKENAK